MSRRRFGDAGDTYNDFISAIDDHKRARDRRQREAAAAAANSARDRERERKKAESHQSPKGKKRKSPSEESGEHGQQMADQPATTTAAVPSSPVLRMHHTGLYELSRRYMLPASILSKYVIFHSDSSDSSSSKKQKVDHSDPSSRIQSPAPTSPKPPSWRKYMQAALNSEELDICRLFEIWCDAASRLSVVATSSSSARSSTSTASATIDIHHLCDLLLQDGIHVPRQPLQQPKEFYLQLLYTNMVAEYKQMKDFDEWVNTNSVPHEAHPPTGPTVSAGSAGTNFPPASSSFIPPAAADTMTTSVGLLAQLPALPSNDPMLGYNFGVFASSSSSITDAIMSPSFSDYPDQLLLPPNLSPNPLSRASSEEHQSYHVDMMDVFAADQ